MQYLQCCSVAVLQCCSVAVYLKVQICYSCEVSGEHFALGRIMVEENCCKGDCIGIQETGAKCNWSERCEHNWSAVYTIYMIYTVTI